MRKINANNADQAKKDLLGAADVATAQAAGVGGLAGQMGEIMGKELEFRNKATKDAIENAERNVKGQETTTDKLTGSLTDAAVKAQEFAVALQDKVLPLIEKFAIVADKMLSEMDKAFKDISKEIDSEKSKTEGKPSEDGAVMSFLKKNAKVLTELGSAGVGMAAGGVVGSLAGPGGAAAGMSIGMQAGQAIGSAVVDMLGLDPKSPGKAAGGVAIGSNRGYLEKLHGTEAVVPLPDGKSIPVNMQMPEAPVPNITVVPPAVNVSPVIVPEKQTTEQPSMISSLFASAVDASAVLKDVLNSGVSKLKDMFDMQKPLSNIQPDNKSTDTATVLAQQIKNLTTGFSDSNKLLQDTNNSNLIKISTGFNSSIEVSEAKFNERYASLATKFADANKGLDPASIASFTNAATKLSLATEAKPAASAIDMASMLKGFANDATSQLGKQDAVRLSTLTKSLGDSSTKLTAKTTDTISKAVNTNNPALATTSEQRIQNMESMVNSFIVDTSGKLTGDWNKFLSDVKESNATAAAAAKPAVEPVANAPAESIPGGLTDVLQKTNESLREVLREQTDLMKDHISRIDRLVDLASTGNDINQQLLNNAY